MSRRRIRWTIAGALPVVAAGAIALATHEPSGGSAARQRVHDSTQRTTLPVYRMDADHPTYDTVGDLRASSDLVVVGTVVSHVTEPGSSPGVDGAGDPLPPIPHTTYAVSVEDVLKGDVVVGDTVSVSLTGGVTDAGRFVLDGGPQLADGDQAMFFLQSGGDGKFYPLAGGAAVADRAPDGSFVLPAEATPDTALTFTRADAAGGGAGTGGAGGGAGGTGGSSGTGSPRSQGAAPDTVAPRVTIRLRAGQYLARALARGLRLSVACSERCLVQASITLNAAQAKRLGAKRPRRSVVVASGRGRGGATLTLRFTPSRARLLRRDRRVELRLTIVAMDDAGNRTATSRRLLLTSRRATLRR
jgi:hypothetical protein